MDYKLFLGLSSKCIWKKTIIDNNTNNNNNNNNNTQLHEYDSQAYKDYAMIAKESKWKTTPMLPPTWIMVLLQFRIGPSPYVIQ